MINLPKHQYPATTTGIFLQRLVNSMDKCRLKPPEDDKFSNGRSKLASSFQLFSAFDFSNMDLVRLIYWIFDDFPESFQLLRCSLSTTNEEVELFFDRINKYPEFRYLILGINTLSLEVQQVWYSLRIHSWYVCNGSNISLIAYRTKLKCMDNSTNNFSTNVLHMHTLSGVSN